MKRNPGAAQAGLALLKAMFAVVRGIRGLPLPISMSLLSPADKDILIFEDQPVEGRGPDVQRTP